MKENFYSTSESPNSSCGRTLQPLLKSQASLFFQRLPCFWIKLIGLYGYRFAGFSRWIWIYSIWKKRIAKTATVTTAKMKSEFSSAFFLGLSFRVMRRGIWTPTVVEISPEDPIFGWLYTDWYTQKQWSLNTDKRCPLSKDNAQKAVYVSLLRFVRTLAFHAKGRRFESGSAHFSSLLIAESTLYTELHDENCVIRCFKWFSNVFERLKPNSFDFSTNSLSRYNTTFPFWAIANAPEGTRLEELCMFGHCFSFHWFSNF